MDKNNLELFKQAISEGLSEKFDSVVDSCNEKIICSEQHELAMRTIVYGKTETKRALSPRMKRIIAIIVAAALLLTSCGIIFRNEIREIFEEFFVKLTYSNSEDGRVIEEIYELGYLPEGYHFNNKTISHTTTNFNYINHQGEVIRFQQRVLDGSDFHIDSENGYSQIKEIEEYEIYYRENSKHSVYVWCDIKYSFYIISDIELSNSILIQIINGLKK